MSQRVFFPTPAGLFALRADLHYSRALSLRSKLHKATQDAWIHLGIDTGSRCLETFSRAGGAVRTADEAITGTRPYAEPPCNERQLEGPSYQAACHVAVLLEALRLLRVASGLQGGPMSTRDWVITGAVQGRQIGPIGELKKKGLADEQIVLSLERRKKCGVGKCGHCQINDIYCCRQGPVFRLDQLADLREAL